MESQEISGSVQLEEREATTQFKQAYTKLLSKMKDYRPDANSQLQGMRVFTASHEIKFGFLTNDSFRRQFGKGIQALYLFRLQIPHKDGYTHGIHIRTTGYAPRRLFDNLLFELVEYAAGVPLELKAVVPSTRKALPLFDYLQSLYVIPQNLLVNYSHQADAMTHEQNQERPNHIGMNALKERMIRISMQILDTIIAMPSKYPLSQLSIILGMTQEQYRKHMRATTLNEIVLKITGDAYNYALQDPSHKLRDVQELMDPLTRRAMLNRLVTEKATKAVQLLLQQTFPVSFVHPHPYNDILKSELHNRKYLDGILFDPRFLLPLLMTARWFARACMREDEVATNNHAHLLLYGGTGTGKSLLLNVIASNIRSYKYLVNSRFQNPDMLQSSIFSIEEFDTKMLASNQYKQLLDLKAHIKTDFKNLHPENVSEGVPCMITSNDEVLSVLQTQRLYGQASIEAALRRLYIIPMKMGQFDKMHTLAPQLESQSQNYVQVLPNADRLMKEPYRLDRMFNFVLAFALYQQDIRGLYLDSRLYSHFQKVIKDFSTSVFGTFYLSSKPAVDKIICELEGVMIKQDLNDTEYLTHFAVCVGNLQQQIYQFMEANLAGIDDYCLDIVKDSTLAWPARMYTAIDNVRFIAKIMWLVQGKDISLLNQEVSAFIGNPQMAMFIPDLLSSEAAIVNNSYEEEKQIFTTPEVKKKRKLSSDDYSLQLGKRPHKYRDFAQSTLNFDQDPFQPEEGLFDSYYRFQDQ